MSFFDAIAPIVHAESIDIDIAWRQSRYDKEGPGGDAAAYINCPLDKAQYDAFVDALLAGPKAEFKDWEHVPYFDGCLPIEVMAERGRETLRHGPMKPVGLTNPHNPTEKALGRRAAAPGQCAGHAVQHGRLPDQAEAWRAGRRVPHDPRAGARRSSRDWAACTATPSSTALALLDGLLRLKAEPRIRFAGQVTGVEGYVESAAIGLLDRPLRRGARRWAPSPSRRRPETALGALVAHVTGGHLESGKGSFQPMNINYGLLPPLEETSAKRRADGSRMSGRGARAGEEAADERAGAGGPERLARRGRGGAGGLKLSGPLHGDDRHGGVEPLAALVGEGAPCWRSGATGSSSPPPAPRPSGRRRRSPGCRPSRRGARPGTARRWRR